MVEAHDDVAPELVLDVHRRLRIQPVLASIHMRTECHAGIVNRADPGHGKDLVAAAIREDRLLPVDEMMQPSCLGHRVFSGMQMQMVRVAQQDLRAEREKILMCESFHRARRSHGHEERCFDGAVRGLQPATTAYRRGMKKSKGRRHSFELRVSSNGMLPVQGTIQQPETRNPQLDSFSKGDNTVSNFSPISNVESRLVP
ncbi:hypothetical protein A2881_01570 [Candidatus Peribacteria bacterium RIFCSPHIGHO2_01_FULL_55_13]|nr:MAG: hypothetical protein A2881_01570 [Candidatus Peribacteria bacterium RIFCSPHIGHO2_01_FULL_55_13]